MSMSKESQRQFPSGPDGKGIRASVTLPDELMNCSHLAAGGLLFFLLDSETIPNTH